MIYCSKCGLANRDGSRFCNECGEHLDEFGPCPRCGFQNPLRARFCNYCGGPMDAALAASLAPTASPPASPARTQGFDSTLALPADPGDKARQRSPAPFPTALADAAALDGEAQARVTAPALPGDGLEQADRPDPDETVDSGPAPESLERAAPAGEGTAQVAPGPLLAADEPAESESFLVPDDASAMALAATPETDGAASEAAAAYPASPESGVSPGPDQQRNWLDETTVNHPAPAITEAGMLFADIVATPAMAGTAGSGSEPERPAKSGGRSIFRLFASVLLWPAFFLSALPLTPAGPRWPTNLTGA